MLLVQACTTGDPGTISAAESYDQMMRLAERTADGGDLDSAAALYAKASEKEPETDAPLLALAEVNLARGEVEGAAAAYRAALQRQPSNAAARLAYGGTLLRLGRYAAAEAEYRAVLAVNARETRASNGLGVSFDVRGQHAEAQQAYRAGLEVAFGTVSLRNNLALSMALSGDYDAAMAGLEALAADPEASERIFHNLALVYALAGRPADAAAVESKAVPAGAARMNLTFYESLRRLNGPALAQAMFAASLQTTPSSGVLPSAGPNAPTMTEGTPATATEPVTVEAAAPLEGSQPDDDGAVQATAETPFPQ